MKLTFINDDPDDRRQLVELANNHYPGETVKAVESAYDAVETRPDVAVFDVSACSTTHIFGHHAYAPICAFLDLCPGASVVITSATSRSCTQEVIDEVERVSGRRPVYGGWGLWDDLKPAIDRVLATPA